MMQDEYRVAFGLNRLQVATAAAHTCHILQDWLGWHAPDLKPNRIAGHCVQHTVAAHADRMAAMLERPKLDIPV